MTLLSLQSRSIRLRSPIENYSNILDIMLTLHQATSNYLSALLDRPERSEIEGLLLPMGEDVVPRFWIELVIDRLDRDPENSFWWSIRLIVVDSLAETLRERLIVGAIGFKSPPDNNGSVEIGYGIVPSQQGRGFATQAVDLLVKEGFSQAEIHTIEACTLPMKSASGRVLEENQFVRAGSKIDPEDGEVWVWRRAR
jgi:RimJ/RimL family protein N-acetyltransferase